MSSPSRSTYRSRVWLLGPALGLLAACGQGQVAAPAPAASGASATPSASAVAAAAVGVGATVGGSSSPVARTAAPTPTASAQKVETAAGANPSASPFPLSAYVTPQCVVPGGTATVHVTTQPRAIVAYGASYHGEKSGAAPPFGYGYGGNDHGDADSSGHWESTWTVRADTPSGAAYVLVVAGYHQAREQVRAPFSVARSVAGGC